MMVKELIRLNHGIEIEDHYYRKIGLPTTILGISIFIMYLVQVSINNVEVSFFHSIIFLVIPIMFPFFVSPMLFKNFMNFSLIYYRPEEIILISPASMISSTRYEYHIKFENIRKISFNRMSTYVIELDKEAVDSSPPPTQRQIIHNLYKYTIPVQLIQDEIQEKRLWKAFEFLDRYYKERGKDFVIFNPPTVLYQQNRHANKPRNKDHDGVIFFVKKYQGE